MDLLDDPLDSSQDKDGECSPEIIPETCLVLEGHCRQVLATVEDDDEPSSHTMSDEDETPSVLHRVQQSTAGSSRSQRTRGTRSRGIILPTPSSSQDLLQSEQFEFRTENSSTGGGTVTYRVVQVAQPGASGGNPNDEIEGLPHIMSGSANFANQTTANQSNAGVQVLTTPLNGQFYVIGSQEMFSPGPQRSIAPRSASMNEPVSGRNNTSVRKRDERRRATHNEVERRRRDKINTWIMKLGKIIPECSPDQSKQGQVSFEGQSKGGILAKACDYICELRKENLHLNEVAKDTERLTIQAESLRQQNEELRREIMSLRNQISQHCLVPNTSQTNS